MEFDNNFMEEDVFVQENHEVNEAKGAMKKAGVFFFLLMILEIPAAFLVHFVQTLFPAEKEMLVSVLMTQGYLLFCAIIYIVVTKQKLQKDLRIRKYKVSTFFLSLLVLITASPMATFFNILSQLFAKNTTSVAIFSITQQVPAWLGIAIIGCLPGFIEETIYRGIMYTAFRKRSVLTGIVVSALSFGLMHMNFNQIMYAIYLGVIFALLVEATGSLVSTMVLHMLFNGVNTAYIYILPVLYKYLAKFNPEYANLNLEDLLAQETDKASLMPMLTLITPVAVGGLVLCILLLKAIASINGRQLTWAYIKGDATKTAQLKPVNVGLIIGWGICLFSAIMELLM